VRDGRFIANLLYYDFYNYRRLPAVVPGQLAKVTRGQVHEAGAHITPTAGGSRCGNDAVFARPLQSLGLGEPKP